MNLRHPLSSLRAASRLPRTAVILSSLIGGLCTGVQAQNLLLNPGFEAGLNQWTVLSSATAMDMSYGSAEVPSVAVAAHIGGGNRLLRDIGGSAVVEQVVVTGPIPAGQSVDVEGYFGGFANTGDGARLVIRFLDAGGNEIAVRPLPAVTGVDRNSETVVMLRRARLAPPAGTEQIAARIEFIDACCGGRFGCADLIFVGLTSAPMIPPPLPLDAEIVTNGDLEGGYAPGSPLSLNEERGWYGSGGVSVVKPYSNADTTVPAVVVAAITGGGAQLLSDLGGAGGLTQTIDLRGNAAQIQAGLSLNVSAYAGGVGTAGDTARVEVEFLDASGTAVGFGVDPVGPVGRIERNESTLVIRRERTYEIPQGTELLRLSTAFEDACCGGAFGLIDNISARLVASTPVAPLPFGVNLVANSSFEMGSLGGSPFELNDPQGWRGDGTGTVEVLFFGASSEAPPGSFAAANGLGGAFLSDGTGGGALSQVRDLRGLATIIDQGQLRVDARCWLGGFGTSADTAAFDIRFLNEFGVPVGLPLQLGPVTAADRANLTTLLEREDSLVAPFGARSMSIRVSFQNACCGGATGFFDAAEVILNDNSSIGSNFCAAAVNSTGLPGQLRGTGSNSVSANNVTLVASGLPGSVFGFFINSQTPGFVVGPGGSSGNLCLAGSIGRYISPVLQSSPMGVMVQPLDLTATPTPLGPVMISVGESWYFQAWHRDQGSTPTSNFTQGLRIDFQ